MCVYKETTFKYSSRREADEMTKQKQLQQFQMDFY